MCLKIVAMRNPIAPQMGKEKVIIINLSGRGDKDVNTAIENIQL